MGGSNGEFQDLTNRLLDRARAYGMEVSTEKSKTMTNSTNDISTDISMNGMKLGEVTSFKYLEAARCKDGAYSARIRTRITSALAAMARQDLMEQHHQLCRQVQTLQVSCHLCPLWL